MTDFEQEIAIPILESEGVDARYRSAVDGEPDGVVDRTVRVLFWQGYLAVNALGVAIDDVQAIAQGARSALSDARTGGLLTVDGEVFVIRSRPQDDGRVWTKLMLEGPIGAA